MKRRKKTGSVFGQLIKSYVLFAFLLVVGLYVCMFGILIGLGNGNLETLAPYELVDQQGNVKNISTWQKNGGWIEKLDSDYQLLNVYGEKQDEKQVYTQEEIYEYLVTDNAVDTKTSAKEYRAFMQTAREKGETYYYLAKMPRNAMSMTYSYNVANNTQGKKLAGGFFLLFVILFAANCFLMSRYLSRKIRKPLRAITEGMEQVVKYGVDEVRLDFQAKREFEEIRDSFNIMTSRLEAEKREKRISEEKKNRMLLELSHDIKTPVATIKSYANALEEGLVEPEKLEDCYRMIDKKAERVDVLVNELFLLLKLDNPEYELELSRTNLCELVRTICALYYEDLERKKIEMHIEIPDTPIWAMTDRKEFTRVMENLLGNIVKYNQTGQGAWVIVYEMAGKVILLVQDDGEAIADEILPVLFDPFVRGDRARTSKGGTGLGLAIARKIVEKLGGEISYEYTEGKNQFKICLSVAHESKKL